jgi:hypothetical protein
MGNCVCKIRTRTEERDQQWGTNVYLELHAIARAKDITSSTLGPSIDAIFSQVFFLPKEETVGSIVVSDYYIEFIFKSKKKDPTSTIGLPPTTPGTQQPPPPTEAVAAAVAAAVAMEPPLLPEFVDVYQVDHYPQKKIVQSKVTKLNFASVCTYYILQYKIQLYL